MFKLPYPVARNEVVNLRQAIKSMVIVQSDIILNLHINAFQEEQEKELEAALTKEFKKLDEPFFSSFGGGIKHLKCPKAGLSRWNLCGKSCTQTIKGIFIHTSVFKKILLAYLDFLASKSGHYSFTNYICC